jgi:septal ring factor EnvC (AmiA/AmiB activator)
MLTSQDIRKRFLDFFAKRGHAILPSASLVPENDPSVLFNTAGMQPLVPYLMGQKHPLGTRLASAQKCVRTGDIEEISEDIDEIQEDVEELSEEENADAEARKEVAVETEKREKREKKERKERDEKEILERLSLDVHKLISELEALRTKSDTGE